MRFLLCLSVVTFVSTLCGAADQVPAWNQKAAAAYLDGRSEWWMSWPNAARDHGTFCVSCHTAAPYAISRLALRGALQEQGLSPLETKLVDNVTKRVKMWAEVEPFYKDGKSGPTKSAESRGTESVLNALILSTYSSSEAKLAFENMWAQQYRTGEAKGSFPWLDFKNRPWEADDSPYYGASLAAIAVGSAGSAYSAQPTIEQNVRELKDYLQSGFDKQSLANQLLALWASAKLSGAVTPAQKQATMDRLRAAQQTDGGWSLTSLAGEWKRRDGTALETKSDGYATGLVAFVLQTAGVSRDQKDMKRALGWLAENQNPEGAWVAYSMNKDRVLTTDVGRFMADAATGYAVLALTGSK